jgi:hypothetical protein
MKELLIKLSACEGARKWAANKSWKEVYDTCHRGDWMLWLHYRTNLEDLQVRTLAKGHCANTVRHLMKDKRSTDAVDAAIAFGEGKITETELKNAATYAAADAAASSATYAAYTAAAATYAAYTAAAASSATYTASYATYAAYTAAAASSATYTASYATYAAYTASSATYAAAAARKLNQQATADIVRKYIPFDQWNCQKMIDEPKTKSKLKTK